MSEKNEKRFLFNINSTNELTEEIYIFSGDNNKKSTILFVLAVITKPLLYLLSLIIGSLVGMIVLGFLKRPVEKPELGKFKGIFYK